MNRPADKDDVGWARLMHAYGAATDTPAHLQALVGDDPAARERALAHLNSAVLHQGSVFPVTAVVVAAVADLLGSPALRRPGSTGDPVLADVVAWLGAVGEACDGDEPPQVPEPDAEDLREWEQALAEDDEESMWQSPVLETQVIAAMIALRSAAPDLLARLEPFLDDADPAVRCQAVAAVARWAELSTAVRESR